MSMHPLCDLQHCVGFAVINSVKTLHVEYLLCKHNAAPHAVVLTVIMLCPHACQTLALKALPRQSLPFICILTQPICQHACKGIYATLQDWGIGITCCVMYVGHDLGLFFHASRQTLLVFAWKIPVKAQRPQL